MRNPPKIHAAMADNVQYDRGWVNAQFFTGSKPYYRRDIVRNLMIELSAGSVPQETIDLCRAEGVDPHDALQMGWAAACFKFKELLDALDEEDASNADTR